MAAVATETRLRAWFVENGYLFFDDALVWRGTTLCTVSIAGRLEAVSGWNNLAGVTAKDDDPYLALGPTIERMRAKQEGD